MKLLLATTSPNKILEQLQALEGLPFELVSLSDFPDLVAPAEPGPGFRDNAAVKALYYHRATGLAAVGEDSGLEVDALDGAPGVQSARWMGHDTPYRVKNQRLLERLAHVAESARTARFVSAVALADSGKLMFQGQETCEGRIAGAQAGTGGFGYDPVFYYPPMDRTLAEMSPEDKNRVSHRGKAMAVLRAYLEKLISS